MVHVSQCFGVLIVLNNLYIPIDAKTFEELEKNVMNTCCIRGLCNSVKRERKNLLLYRSQKYEAY